MRRVILSDAKHKTTKAETMTGHATYTNKATGEQYRLGFEMNESDTEIGKARQLINTVAAINGWNAFDVRFTAGR